MKIRAVFLSLMLLVLFARISYSGDLDDARFEFHQGNTAYSAAEYEKAIAHYEQVLSLSFESGPLYYNLANAYFKAGFLGRAVLNYLRARRLMPRDADLISNLAYARSRIKGGMVQAERNYLLRTFLAVASGFSLDAITALSFVLYILFSVLIILIIILKNSRRPLIYIIIPVAALLVISVSIFAVRFNMTVMQKEAVVVAEEADSKFEPADEATTFFSLNEGENVFVAETRPGWAKIRRPDGKQGWVRTTAIELI